MPDTQSSNTQDSASQSNYYSIATLEDFNKSLKSIQDSLYTAAKAMSLHMSLREAKDAMEADETNGVVVPDEVKNRWKEAEDKLNLLEERPMNPNDPGVKKHRQHFASQRRGSS